MVIVAEARILSFTSRQHSRALVQASNSCIWEQAVPQAQALLGCEILSRPLVFWDP